MNCFIVSLFAGAKTPLQRCRWLIKTPPPSSFYLKTSKPDSAFVKLQKSSCGCSSFRLFLAYSPRSLFSNC